MTRSELHEGTATRKALTFHDLRATGITWCAVRGDDNLKLKYRAGHKSFATTEIYIREADAIREGFGEPFPPLPQSLLEGKTVSRTVSSFAHQSNTKRLFSAGTERGGRDSNPRPPA